MYKAPGKSFLLTINISLKLFINLKLNFMKFLTKITVFFALCILSSCQFLSSPFYDSKESVDEMIEMLNDKFTPDAGYTNIDIGHSSDLGRFLVLTAAKDINSNKLERWRFTTRDGWEQLSDITMEIDGDFPPAEFMFQLKDVPVEKMADIALAAVEKVKSEKDIDEVVCTGFSFWLKSRNHENKMEDLGMQTSIEPANGGTKFRCELNQAGEIVDMRY